MKKYTNDELHELLESQIDHVAHGIDYYHGLIDHDKIVNHNAEHIFVMTSLCESLVPLMEYARDRWPDRKEYFDQLDEVRNLNYFKQDKELQWGKWNDETPAPSTEDLINKIIRNKF